MNKLVRDRIPEIIEKSGKSCVARILDHDEYIEKLEEKLGEELSEYLESKEPEELADLLEVIDALIIATGHTKAEILAIQAEKKAARGGFEKKILLEISRGDS